jgi:hypothetical protein
VYDGSSGSEQILFGKAKMTVRRKEEFEEAVIKYGLAAGKVIRFGKNEKTKVRAVCAHSSSMLLNNQASPCNFC